MIFRFCFLVSLVFVGCVKTKADSITKTAPYKVRGKYYRPQKHYEYNAVGYASWYGPGFHGKKNACGSTFDENSNCAAHRTLPLPCIARVHNLKNGKSVKVLVTDRGPYLRQHRHDERKRIIDLSKGAARRLGINGLGYVHVESLPKESLYFAQYVRRYKKHYKTKHLNYDKIFKKHFYKHA